MVRRIFGLTIGTIDDRIQDPKYSDVALVGDFFRSPWPHYKAPFKKTGLLILTAFSRYNYLNQDKNKLRIRDELVRKINNGTASTDLIPYLEEKAREEYTKNHSFQWWARRDMERKFKEKHWKHKYSLNIFSLYKELIDMAETKESIPYLLQAIELRLTVREDEAFRTDPEIFLEEDRRCWSEEQDGPSYGMIATYHISALYNVFVQVSFHKVYMPFAQAAKEKLSTMVSLVDDKTAMKIGAAIERLDEELKIPIAHHKKVYKEVSRTTTR